MSPFSSLVKFLCILCLLFVSTYAHEHEYDGGFEFRSNLKHRSFPGSRTPWEVNPDLGNDHKQNGDLSSGKENEEYDSSQQDNSNKGNDDEQQVDQSQEEDSQVGNGDGQQLIQLDKKHGDEKKLKKKPKVKKEPKIKKDSKTKKKHKGGDNDEQQPQPQQPPLQQQPQPQPQQPPPQPQQPPFQQQPQPQPQQPPLQQQPQPQQPPLQQGQVVGTDFKGVWELAARDSGVSAMHMQLLPNNKVIMFDATSLGKSNIQLPPNNCRIIPIKNIPDCFAHSVEYDPLTNQVRTLKVTTDPWCSSGGLAPDGTLVGTGGWADGGKTIRYMPPCPGCDWRESMIKLGDDRWYATQTMLGDGRFVVIGGRRAFSYEFLAPENLPAPPKIDLPFLRETTDIHENNLYPFVHVAPNGNLFILANNRAILLDVKTNIIVKNYPDLPGGARNYPGSGSSTILPIDLRAQRDPNLIDIEVIVCGGGQPLAFGKAEKENIYLPALDSCGRIKVLDPLPKWEMENMPTPRVMGDMLNLPNGQLLILNGAKKGASGWQFADDPNMVPLIYTPNKLLGQRFKSLNPTQIPRMYHSTSAVLPEGKILVAGSNTNPNYQFVNVKFPTELRVEKFSPPYLDPKFDQIRPVLDLNSVSKGVKYLGIISLEFKINEAREVNQDDVMVTLYQPPFTTHGYSMNQRILILPITNFNAQMGNCKAQVQAPAKGDLAPPGYYLLFVNHKGVPSQGAWVQVQM